MYIVSGVSRGLGKALVLELLALGNQVIGVGRTNSIEHPNYSFFNIDLRTNCDLSHLKIDYTKPITLINNAGIIGEISRISQQDDWDLTEVLKVNTIAPFDLAKQIYSKLKDKDGFTLVNISSGAAKKSIPSWAAYCASKAALNMLSENFLIEEQEIGNHPKVYCVAPGVIDTDMQKYIRNASEEKFSQRQRFVELKENDELFSPEECAGKLLKLLRQPFDGRIFYDLRDF